MAAPMPFDAPVTRATFPFKSRLSLPNGPSRSAMARRSFRDAGVERNLRAAPANPAKRGRRVTRPGPNRIGLRRIANEGGRYGAVPPDEHHRPGRRRAEAEDVQ